MRIAMDARILTLPQIRGMGNYILEILKAWPEPGDQFFLFAEPSARQPALSLPNPLEWHRVPSPRGSRVHIWDWWALPRALKRSSFSPDLFWSPANRIFPLGRLPQVVTVHDTLLQEKVRFDDPVERIYHRWWPRAAARKYARKIITVSRFSASRIHKVFHYPRHRIHTVYNGATLGPHRQASEEPSPLRSDTCPVPPLPIPTIPISEKNEARPPYIYALGAESPWKNTIGVLKAFAHIQRIVPGINLIISGVQDRFMPILAHQCQKLNLRQDRIILKGFVDDTTRDRLYAAAAVFIYPSLFEGFGLPPLEAMALGTPVVASHAASIPEVVGRAALLTDASRPECLAHAVIRVLKDKALRQRLITRGRQHITRFQWQTSACRHRQIMAAAIEQTRIVPKNKIERL